MNIKIIRHLTVANNEPAVEYERVNLWGEVGRGIRLTDGLEGQDLLEAIEKDDAIADEFSAAGEEMDDLPPDSLAWRMNAEAGTLKYPPPPTKRGDSRPPKAPETPAPQVGGLSPPATPVPFRAAGK